MVSVKLADVADVQVFWVWIWLKLYGYHRQNVPGDINEFKRCYLGSVWVLLWCAWLCSCPVLRQV